MSTMYRPHWMSPPPTSAFEQAGHLHQPNNVPHQHQLQSSHQSWNSARTPPPSSSYASTLPPTPPKDMTSHEAGPSAANNMSPSSVSPPPLITKQEFPHQHLGDDHRGGREAKSPTSASGYYHPEMNSSPGGFNSFTPNSGVCGGQRQSIDSPNGNYSSSQSNSRSKSSKNRPNAGKQLNNVFLTLASQICYRLNFLML